MILRNIYLSLAVLSILAKAQNILLDDLQFETTIEDNGEKSITIPLERKPVLN